MTGSLPSPATRHDRATAPRVGVALSLALSLAAVGCAAARPATAPQPSRAVVASGAVASSAPAPVARPAPGAAPGSIARSTPGADPHPARARAGASALVVGTWRLASPAPELDAPPRGAEPLTEITLELGADGTWSIAGRSYHARGTYRWVGAEELETTVVASDLDVQLGSVSRKRVAVDATDLALTVAPDDAKARPGEAGGVTRFKRVTRR